MDAPTAASTGAPTAASTDAPAEGKPKPKSTNVGIIAGAIVGALLFILIAYYIYSSTCGSAQKEAQAEKMTFANAPVVQGVPASNEDGLLTLKDIQAEL
jgi:hypothetical protein